MGKGKRRQASGQKRSKPKGFAGTFRLNEIDKALERWRKAVAKKWPDEPTSLGEWREFLAIAGFNEASIQAILSKDSVKLEPTLVHGQFAAFYRDRDIRSQFAQAKGQTSPKKLSAAKVDEMLDVWEIECQENKRKPWTERVGRESVAKKYGLSLEEFEQAQDRRRKQSPQSKRRAGRHGK